jgi:hypothetical protein
VNISSGSITVEALMDGHMVGTAAVLQLTKLLAISTHCKPSYAYDNIKASFRSSGILEGPHAIAVHIPIGTGSRVHAPLTNIPSAAIG